MNSWFTKNLGDAMLAGDSLDHIKALFASKCALADNPQDMAIFIRHETESHLYCAIKVYFSPASAYVAKEVDATPCNQPSPDNLELLAGPEACRSIFFPERSVSDK